MISIIEEIWPILYNQDGISSVMSFKLADEDFLASFFKPTPKMVSEASVIAFCAFKILSIRANSWLFSSTSSIAVHDWSYSNLYAPTNSCGHDAPHSWKEKIMKVLRQCCTFFKTFKLEYFSHRKVKYCYHLWFPDKGNFLFV